MSTVSVTYHAPEGDSKVCEWQGHTFFDGKVTEVEENDANKQLLEKLKSNARFECSGGEGEQAPPFSDYTATDEDADNDKSGKAKHGRRR